MARRTRRNVRPTAALITGRTARDRDPKPPKPPRQIDPALIAEGLRMLDENPPKAVAARPRPASSYRETDPPRSSRLEVGSSCEVCGKWLPGERSLCGSCYVKRDAARKRDR